MTAESNVGARLFLIGKDATLAGVKEITAAVAEMNGTIADGAGASKAAAAGYADQGAALEALQAKMDLYQANLVETTAATDSLARVGKVAFLALAAAGAAWTYESIRWAQSYQAALVQLRTQAGLTVTAMNAIGAAAMRNAASLGISPTAYLQAAYHPASTGYGVGETIAITNYGAKLAAIGGASSEDTVNSLTSTMKAYGFGTGQTEHTAALLNAIVGSGNMHWSDLNAALNSGVASTAKTFGVSLSSLGGALARLTDLGTPAAQAGTRLRMAMALLGAPTQESDKLLTAAGLDTTDATAASSAMASALVSAGLTTTQLSSALRNNSGAGGIYNALELLHRQLSGMSPEAQSALLSRAFGGGRMGTSIMQLYSNLPALETKSGQIKGGSSNQKFMQDWIATTKTLRFQTHALGAELETLGTQFGTKLLPYVTDGVKDFTKLLEFFDHNKGAAIALGGAVTAILAPAMGLYLVRSIGNATGAIGNMIQGYRQLITGQTAERAALLRTDGALATTTAETRALSAAEVVAGRGMLALIAALLSYEATMKLLQKTPLGKLLLQDVADPIAHLFNKAPQDVAKQETQKLLTYSTIKFLDDVASGETVDKSLSASAAASELKEAGLSVPAPPRARTHIVAHVSLDGKEITASVKQNVKRKANRR